MSGRGRPVEYDPAIHDDIITWGEQGCSKVEIAVKLGIARSTLYKWMTDFPDFSDVIKRAEDASEAWYYKTFKDMAIGNIDKAQAVPLIFAGKNQLPNTFRDRREHKVDAEIGIFEIDFTGYDEES